MSARPYPAALKEVAALMGGEAHVLSAEMKLGFDDVKNALGRVEVGVNEVKEGVNRVEKILLASAAAAKDAPSCYAYVAVQRPPTVSGQAHSLSNFAACIEGMRSALVKDEQEWRGRGCCPVSLNDGGFSRIKTDLMHGRVHSLVWCAPGFGWEAPSDIPPVALDALCDLLREPGVSAPSLILLCFKRGGRRAAVGPDG